METTVQAHPVRDRDRSLRWTKIVLVLAAFGGSFFLIWQEQAQAEREAKLGNDTALINSALGAFLEKGGKFPKRANANEVLELLKNPPPSEEFTPSPSGPASFLDPRIYGRSITSKRTLRAVWSDQFTRFFVKVGTEGFTDFYLSSGASERSFGAVNDRNASAANGQKQEGAIVPENASAGLANSVSLAGGIRQLEPPVFAAKGGTYPYAAFPMPLPLSNPNKDVPSKVFYSVNSGPWIRYDGTAILLPKETIETSIKAYVASDKTDQWQDSAASEEIYRTLFLIGRSEGKFSDAAGEERMVSNIAAGATDSHFQWGSPSGKQDRNGLEFKSGGNFVAVPDQDFVLGEISYGNGTSLPETAATSIDLRLKFIFAVPAGENESRIRLRIVSTPDQPGADEDTNADYVWLPASSSRLSEPLQGEPCYLRVHFGDGANKPRRNSDEFHVHEGKTRTAILYGCLSRTTEAPKP